MNPSSRSPTSPQLEHRVASIATIAGIAAPYGEETLVGYQREKIAMGAFRESLGRGDLVARWAHEPEQVLGSVKGGTFKVWDSPEGLRYRVALPDTTTGNDLKVLVERGEMGASIGFVGSSSKATGDEVRVWEQIDLREISLTANPAYKSTSAEVLTTDPNDTERERWLLGIV